MSQGPGARRPLKTPAGLNVLCCCLALPLSGFGPAAGKPVQPGSPGPVVAVAGDRVVLRCPQRASDCLSGVPTLEWFRANGSSVSTVLVLRGRQELVKDKAAEYWGRTEAAEDGSLVLDGVTRRDSGTYRCFIRCPGVSTKGDVLLVVAEVSELNVTVHRTSSNQLQLHCQSSGWNPKPQASLLDAGGGVLPVETEPLAGPDGLYSVGISLDLAVVKGILSDNGAVICRVEIPELNLTKEEIIQVIDEFDLEEAGPRCRTTVIATAVITTIAIALISFVTICVVPIEKVSALKSLLWRVKALVFNKKPVPGPDDQQLLLEYGDILNVDTTGASEDNAKENKLFVNGRPLRGVEASQELAKRDLKEMLKYRESIVAVGRSIQIHPALIAAIISRQSQAGTRLGLGGYGRTDPNCFGLMQINRHYHAVKGNPFSQEHLDQGVTFLIQIIKTMWRTKPSWSREQQLKGALACYIAGEEQVIPLAYEDVDSVTPYQDFANDVVARAKWFANNCF